MTSYRMERDGESGASHGVLDALWAACLALCLATFAFGVLRQFSYLSLEDDSFMFYRYAHRLATEHRLSWNPHGEQTYGLTALGYLAVVLPLYLVFRQEPAMTVCAASFLSGLVFLAILWLTVLRHCRRGAGMGRGLSLLLGLTVAVSSPSLAHHFSSGMDTTFSMAFLMSYILLCAEFERRASPSRAVALGAWGGLAFTVRPDLLLFSLAIPCCWILFEKESFRRRLAWLVLATTALFAGLQVLLASIFLHSPVPLPFYAKSLHLYDEYIFQFYARGPRFELFQFCRLHIHLIAIIAACVLLNPAAWWRRASALDKGLVAAAIAFMSYYWLFVLQILGGWQRFYYPVLPALAYLACRSISFTLPDWLSQAPNSRAWRQMLAFGLLAGLICLGPLFWGEFGAYRVARQQSRTDHISLVYCTRERWQGSWIALERISRLPDDLVIATTEVGLPGVLNLDKIILDMAGLQNTSFAHAPFSANLLLAKDRPDMIYMPHPHYKKMIREIESHPLFLSDYDFFPAERYNALSGVAIRRQSSHYPDLRRILLETPPFPSMREPEMQRR